MSWLKPRKGNTRRKNLNILTNVSNDMLESLEGYLGIEIFNGVIFRLEGSGLADDVWDNVLSKGRLIWGFAMTISIDGLISAGF